MPSRFLGLGALLNCVVLGGCAEAPEVQRPQCERGTNVVIFLIDTLRADRLGVYGYGRGTSPNMDALAAESVVFERAHAPAPWTLPSVASLMVGSLLPSHGVVKDGDRISSESVTLAESLRDLGYSTGSYLHNPYAGVMTGLDRGFDVCEQADRVVGQEQVKSWLNAEPEHPFFLYLHNTIPHDPYRPAPEFLMPFGQVEASAVDQIHQIQEEYRQLTRENFAPWKEKQGIDNSGEQAALVARLAAYKREIDDLYDGEVLQVDHVLGEVIELLKLRGEWENTIFIVLADHGEELDDHGGWEHDHSVYEELLHVPLLMRLPGAEHAGRRVKGAVSLIDVYPTLLELLGESAKQPGLEGQSLLEAIQGALLPSGPRVTSYRLNQKKRYTPHREQRGIENMVICEGDWKAIWNVQLGSMELYDIAQDPGEQNDLAGSNAELCARLREFGARERRRMQEQRASRASGAAGASTLGAADKERLKALGYLGDDE